MHTQVEGWISRASARQRRGRAGRVAAGFAFALYTRKRAEVIMSPFQKPEMVRPSGTSLCQQWKQRELINTPSADCSKVPRKRPLSPVAKSRP
jgi:HrpA-like RNA helicase